MDISSEIGAEEIRKAATAQARALHKKCDSWAKYETHEPLVVEAGGHIANVLSHLGAGETEEAKELLSQLITAIES